MKLAKWDDGYVLETDPRREDPLYYYMREGGWGSAVGIEVSPLYDEHAKTKVTIRVWLSHLPREAGMISAERCEMFRRVVSVLLLRFPRWSHVTLQTTYMAELVGRGEVAVIFKEAGFSCFTSTAGEETWMKD